VDKIQIIKDLIPGALLSYEKYKILPSLTIAQAILETGWLQYVKGNNIFGIKWTKDCGYEAQELGTHELINGISTPMVCKFRKYDTIGDSLLDHGKLLSYSRYKSVITSKDYKEACQNVYNSGYCTDTEYPKKLISIIEQNKLYIYDVTPIFKSTISSNSENIKYIQSCLNKLKIKDVNNNVLVADGFSGPLTTSSINKFQNIIGITTNGLCGENTLNAITNIMKKPVCSINSTTNKIAVRYLQYRVNADIDGYYGAETKMCVTKYQRTNKLLSDGIVGKNSWQFLLS